MSTTVKIGSKTLFATPTGVKLGSRGKVQPAGTFLRTLPKGERRQARKALRRAGFAAHAAS